MKYKNKTAGPVFVLLLQLIVPSLVVASAVDLPQTGQVHSYHHRDDGEDRKGIPWPNPRFEDNGDGTISDHLTGLMWMKDASCADTANLYAGSDVSSLTQAFEYIAKLNQKTNGLQCLHYTANYDDWQLPNIVELVSLLSFGLEDSQGFIDGLVSPPQSSTGFSNLGLVHEPAWSVTPSQLNPEQVWAIDFTEGRTLLIDKENTLDSFHIFSAVRIENESKLQAPSLLPIDIAENESEASRGKWIEGERFFVNENASIIDRQTGLRWLNVNNCIQGQTWEGALSYIDAQNKRLAPFSECLTTDINTTTWRVPNILELHSLLDYSKTPSDAISIIQTLPSSGIIISSTGSKDDGENFAWGIDLSNGEILPSVSKSDTSNYIIAVSGPATYADIRTTPRQVDFGSYFKGKSISEIITLEIWNTGNGILNMDFIEVNSAIDDEFTPGRDQCSNTELSPDHMCEFEIRFQPRKTGKRTATISIPSNALSLETYTVGLIGTGLADDEPGNPACFIATAAYGTPLAPQIDHLRDFRDRYLITNDLGMGFVEIYYRYSPPIAEFITQHEWAKRTARGFVVVLITFINHPWVFFCLFFFVSILLVRRINRRFIPL